MSSRRSSASTSHKSSCSSSSSSSSSSSAPSFSSSSSSSKRLRTGKSGGGSASSSMRKKSRERSEDRSGHRGERRAPKQRRVLPPRSHSGSESESVDSDSEEDLPSGRLTLHERFGSLPPPPDMFEERQRDVEVERVRKRATTSFAITMNELSNPDRQGKQRQTSSERFGRIQSTAAPNNEAVELEQSFAAPLAARQKPFDQQEVSFQTHSLQQFHPLKDEDLADPLLYDQYLSLQQPPLRAQQPQSQHQPQFLQQQQHHHQQQQQHHHQQQQQHQRFPPSNNNLNENNGNPMQYPNFPSQQPVAPLKVPPQLRLDPQQLIYQNPSMLQSFVNAMQAARPLNVSTHSFNNMRESHMRDNYMRESGMREREYMRENAQGGPRENYEENDSRGPSRREHSPSGEFDLLAMGEPTNQPWQLRQSVIAGVDKEAVGAAGRVFGRGRGSRERGGPSKGKGNEQRNAREAPFLPPTLGSARPPMPPLPPSQLRPLRPQFPPARGPAPLGPPMLPRPPQGPPMRPDLRLPGPDVFGGPQQRMLPPMGPGMPHPHLPMLPPHPMALGPPQPHLLHMGPQQPNNRMFPMGGAPPQFRPPMGPQGGLRLQGLAPRPPVMPAQPKALVPPGGWAHLPSKVVGAHAPRGAGGPRRAKPGRPPPLEPKNELDADLDQYRSEGLKGSAESGDPGDARSEDEIDAPATEEDLGDIGVLE